ncbi:aminoglycoside phosphotransferase family protein [Microbacterium sp. QXD-8]|uniref:Aminoglycoside phosphotransferase family protein n=1 Tax=Microbacterium psychrotolerans TaxID=3068321 RepID=A0ABU0Z6B1_9MICO|nr:aminoglycoside phosphotransferase family protein [Microbacterium sp. QXD-8]MDQ7880130.1 aminoglycoside phosphotransferase family protein [Microbacterium sp. QXD-8]
MLTKFVVDEAQLADLVAPVGRLAGVEPLTGGMFATAFRLHFDDGRRAVAKIVGADTSRLATYERGLLGTEALTYRMLAGSGVPVPRVLHTDFTRVRLDADVIVAEHLPGVPWLGLELDAAQAATVRRNLGAVMADLHRVTAPSFGYPAADADLAAGSWREAFQLMVEAILADAARWGVTLPVARVRAAVVAHAGALDAVTRASVVHTDLWEGNVFVDPDTLDIVGIIDTERTLWGDPIHELVGADQFGTDRPSPDLLAGDAAAGGVLARELATPTGETRLQLSRLYFSLILATEPTMRGYEGGWGAGYERGARANIDRALELLETMPAAR